ncbi:LysR substrate-binding domain-containing protein [Streptomyces sp. NPDC048483]|uniref:LysR substrate-binding domain-containing protein n=1 Tax=Streptomyces sp. NPDC048483 TaxID=3154927 RepID=UPI0034312731
MPVTAATREMWRRDFLARVFTRPGIQTRTLAAGPHMACMSAADAVASHGPLTLAQLSDRPFIGWSPKIPNVWRDFWACDPRLNGAPVTYSDHQVEEFEPALSATAHGEGIEFPLVAAVEGDIKRQAAPLEQAEAVLAGDGAAEGDRVVFGL